MKLFNLFSRKGRKIRYTELITGTYLLRKYCTITEVSFCHNTCTHFISDNTKRKYIRCGAKK